MLLPQKNLLHECTRQLIRQALHHLHGDFDLCQQSGTALLIQNGVQKCILTFCHDQQKRRIGSGDGIGCPCRPGAGHFFAGNVQCHAFCVHSITTFQILDPCTVQVLRSSEGLRFSHRRTGGCVRNGHIRPDGGGILLSEICLNGKAYHLQCIDKVIQFSSVQLLSHV